MKLPSFAEFIKDCKAIDDFDRIDVEFQVEPEAAHIQIPTPEDATFLKLLDVPPDSEIISFGQFAQSPDPIPLDDIDCRIPPHLLLQMLSAYQFCSDFANIFDFKSDLQSFLSLFCDSSPNLDPLVTLFCSFLRFLNFTESDCIYVAQDVIISNYDDYFSDITDLILVKELFSLTGLDLLNILQNLIDQTLESSKFRSLYQDSETKLFNLIKTGRELDNRAKQLNTNKHAKVQGMQLVVDSLSKTCYYEALKPFINPMYFVKSPPEERTGVMEHETFLQIKKEIIDRQNIIQADQAEKERLNLQIRANISRIDSSKRMLDRHKFLLGSDRLGRYFWSIPLTSKSGILISFGIVAHDLSSKWTYLKSLEHVIEFMRSLDRNLECEKHLKGSINEIPNRYFGIPNRLRNLTDTEYDVLGAAFDSCIKWIQNPSLPELTQFRNCEASDNFYLELSSAVEEVIRLVGFTKSAIISGIAKSSLESWIAHLVAHLEPDSDTSSVESGNGSYNNHSISLRQKDIQKLKEVKCFSSLITWCKTSRKWLEETKAKALKSKRDLELMIENNAECLALDRSSRKRGKAVVD
jgi:hypothetical protein